MMNKFSYIKEDQHPKACWGYCSFCNIDHFLTDGHSRQYCIDLMDTLKKKKRVDLTVPDSEADPRYSTDYLFGPARGQMFGVMVYRKPDGTVSTAKAFSGQYDGQWEIEGWVNPLFNVHAFNTISFDVEKQIKKLGRRIDMPGVAPALKNELIRQRKKLSQQLMKDIHSLYRLTNFRGETKTLNEVFTGTNGIPTGTGDCCAPKLLNFAAQNELQPLGLAEFYWGMGNRSGLKIHGHFYPSCKGKCQPILGFILCGLSDEK